MDPLEITYESLDKVPEAFRPLYAEQDGKAVLTNVNGVKTQSDVDKIAEGLRKEREDHRALQELHKPWKGMDHADVTAKLAKYPELETAAQGKLDESQISDLVKSRLSQETAPIQAKLNEAMTERDAITLERDELLGMIQRRDMSEAIRPLAVDSKAHASAMPDIEGAVQSCFMKDDVTGNYVVRKDNSLGITEGMDMKGFLKELQKLRPHYWPESEGGNAQGDKNVNGGTNPWNAKNWNVTAQSRIMREQGREVAERMAKAAGSSLGGIKPRG